MGVIDGNVETGTAPERGIGDVASITVLHVDDEPALVDLSATYLERADDDLTVLTATSGREGLATLDGATEIDCVVSDYEMPEMDGLAFLEAVRERAPCLPFVMFSRRDPDAVESPALERGADAYQQKSTDVGQYERLAECIRETVEDRSDG